MNFKLPVTLLCASYLLCTGAHAQKTEGMNIGKINLSALAFKNICLQYERKVGPRVTLALGYSLIPTSTLSFKGYFNDLINNPRVNINDFKLGASIITPELRYYFGTKGAFHGFYLGPYLRYSIYNLSGPVTYNSSTGVERVAFFDGKINMFSGGILLGSNFHLSKKLYLDWWIIGGSIGKASGNVRANTPLDPDEQEGLKDELDRTDVPLTNIHSEVNSQGATVTSTGSMVGIRGLGINIGLRF